MKLKIDKLFIPHYTRLKERKKALSRQLDELAITPIWVEKFDQEDIDSLINKAYAPEPKLWHKRCLDLYKEPPTYRKLKKSEISLALKHLECYRQVVDKEIKEAIIVEDDVILDKNFCETFNLYLKQTPRDYDMIYFSSHFSWDKLNDGSGNSIPLATQPGKYVYKRAHPATNCTDSYIITFEAAKKLLDKIDKIVMPIDFELNYYLKILNFNVYWWAPGLTKIAPYISSIQGSP
ncbi:MAG: glycosyltransferase family 25 protein [Candidatus Omnitrophica bacterium]|nr:glycosyltransferase family 25 protein [Candidatus Omnitrophota bacterium]